MSSNASPARIVAARVLQHLERDEHAFSAETLGKAIISASLSDADARLATIIVYGTLRNALLLDHQYRQYLRKSPSKLATELRLFLRMAGFQKFFLERIPDHAIANDLVDIAKRDFRLHPRDVSFLNAIMRRLLSNEDLRAPQSLDDEALSIRYSHPVWLVRYLRAKFGEPNLIRILESNNVEAELTLRVNVARTSIDAIRNLVVELGGRCDAGRLCPEALRVRDLPVQALVKHPAFIEGMFYLQDEGSQVIAHLVGPGAGERILDLCAAPGGKSTHLAELAAGRAQIVATDISDSRLQTLHQNLERLKTTGVEVLKHEVLSERAEYLGSFDAVLVDAPCSGLGTLRRNPEIRYRISQERLNQLGKSQLQVLAHAAKFVKPGGRLVYSTCTVTKEENAAVNDAFLENHTHFAKAPGPGLLPEQIAQLCQPDGSYRTWPAHLDMDGFEAVILRHMHS